MTSTPLKTSDISIIIPTLNEQDNIAQLAACLGRHDGEILIVDGGSTDETVTLAAAKGFHIVQGRPGRARQLNHGARLAKGRILLFLHADTRLPENFGSAVIKAVARQGFIAGAFRLAVDDPTPAMRFICACANLRSRLFHLPYGDQALFFTRAGFFSLNMFPDLPIMEDYMLMRLARTQGQVILLPQQAVTSARRWKQLGVLRTTIINQLVIIGFFLKISPQRLRLFYRR